MGAVARILIGYFHETDVNLIPDIAMSPGIYELTRSHSAFETSHFMVKSGNVSMLARKIDRTSVDLRSLSRKNVSISQGATCVCDEAARDDLVASQPSASDVVLTEYPVSMKNE